MPNTPLAATRAPAAFRPCRDWRWLIRTRRRLYPRDFKRLLQEGVRHREDEFLSALGSGRRVAAVRELIFAGVAWVLVLGGPRDLLAVGR